MASLTLAVLAALLCTAFSSDADVTVSLDISDSQVHAGANITLNCRIKGISPGEIVYWSKGERVGDDNVASQLIATNDLLSPLYQETKRYQAQVVQIADAYLFIMHIYGVTEYESGNYVCSIPRLDYQYAYKPLFVFEQPKDVRFLNMTEDETVVFTEGVPRDIHCHIEEVNPVPKITLQMGNRQLSNVSIEPIQNIHCRDSTLNCPQNTDFDVHATLRKHNASWEDDGEILICRSHLQESSFPKMEAHQNVKVLYRPKFICSKVLGAALGRSRYNITCTARLNPLPLELQSEGSGAHWAFTVDGVDAKIYNGQSIGGYSVYEQAVNDTARNYTLVIDMVRPSHINVTYNLHVENTIGSNSTGIFLKQERNPNPVRPIGGATTIVLSFTNLFLATLFSIIH